MDLIWWEQVSNAVKYVRDIKNSLLEEKSILLRCNSYMPWPDQLVMSVEEGVKLLNGDKKFVDIGVVDEPGKYILQEFCKEEKRAAFRPSKGYAKFFAENEDIVLHDRYLWVQVSDEANLEAWLAFVSEYLKERGRKANKAVFILEVAGDFNIANKKGIGLFSFEDYIGEYDRVVFAVLAASLIKEDSFIKRYLTELVANVAGNDIELAAECIADYKSFVENPLVYIQRVVAEKIRSDGADYVYAKSAEDVAHLVWLSQIKIIYPYIEEYREAFVAKYYQVIAKELPIQASYGETYGDPKDVELGTLLYMVGNGYINLSTAEYEMLKRYKDARNKLSHLAVLSMDEISELLN